MHDSNELDLGRLLARLAEASTSLDDARQCLHGLRASRRDAVERALGREHLERRVDALQSEVRRLRIAIIDGCPTRGPREACVSGVDGVGLAR